MILNRWAEIWRAYRENGSPKLFRTVFHYSKIPENPILWFSVGVYLVAACMFSSNEWDRASSFVLLLLSFWLLFISVENALSREFAAEYKFHSLAEHSFGERRLYLRYALFLRHLARNNIEKEHIQAVSEFSKKAGSPAPVFSLSQHPAVVPLLTVITVLTIDLIKESATWKAGQGAVILVVIAFLVLFIFAILDVVRSSKQKHVELARFIEWATMDLDRAKSNYAFDNGIT